MNNDKHNRDRNHNQPRHRFAHERLDIYHVALRLFREIYRLAEGANRMSHKDKASRFIVARGECGETACGLDLLLVLELVA